MRDYDEDQINDAFDAIAAATTPIARKEAIEGARRLCLREMEALTEDEEDGDDEDCETVIEAVEKLLDEVQRPVGKLTFTVPATPAVDRALLRLHDVVNRNI